MCNIVFIIILLIVTTVIFVFPFDNEFLCGAGNKLVDGRCVRNIEKCISWECDDVCGKCEKGYDLHWYGDVAGICYPNYYTAKKYAEILGHHACILTLTNWQTTISGVCLG